MERRVLGRTGFEVSAVGLGCWQLGGDWGEVTDDAAHAILRTSLEHGVTLLDTADVYGDGRSERLIGELLAHGPSPDGLVVATKAGRRADPHVADAFHLDNLRSWADRSRRNLGVEALDLLQLHCPPPEVYGRDEAFDALDRLVDDGLIRHYGVSVETRAEAMAALERPNVATIQIITNVFRQQPTTDVLPAARDAGVGILVRVPLASGLLSGKYDESTTFAADDHRTFNRDGAAFDVGETFAGVPFEVGVRAAREVAQLTPEGWTTAQLALRWCLDQPGVSTVIPGARTPEQARFNAEVGALPSLPAETTDALAAIYDEHVAPHVHDRW